ncbi:MAG: hypothetical protein ACUZ8I_17890 [Candidatus Scalindua sp.]
MRSKTRIHYKNQVLILYVLLFVIFMSGCYTTAPNIESTGELKEKKLLAGRFVFHDNNQPVGIEGWTIFFKHESYSGFSSSGSVSCGAAQIRAFQARNWDVTRKYISSKFGVLPESIRKSRIVLLNKTGDGSNLFIA